MKCEVCNRRKASEIIMAFTQDQKRIVVKACKWCVERIMNNETIDNDDLTGTA